MVVKLPSCFRSCFQPSCLSSDDDDDGSSYLYLHSDTRRILRSGLVADSGAQYSQAGPRLPVVSCEDAKLQRFGGPDPALLLVKCPCSGAANLDPYSAVHVFANQPAEALLFSGAQPQRQQAPLPSAKAFDGLLDFLWHREPKLTEELLSQLERVAAEANYTVHSNISGLGSSRKKLSGARHAAVGGVVGGGASNLPLHLAAEAFAASIGNDGCRGGGGPASGLPKPWLYAVAQPCQLRPPGWVAADQSTSVVLQRRLQKKPLDVHHNRTEGLNPPARLQAPKCIVAAGCHCIQHQESGSEQPCLLQASRTNTLPSPPLTSSASSPPLAAAGTCGDVADLPALLVRFVLPGPRDNPQQSIPAVQTTQQRRQQQEQQVKPEEVEGLLLTVHGGVPEREQQRLQRRPLATANLPLLLSPSPPAICSEAVLSGLLSAVTVIDLASGRTVYQNAASVGFWGDCITRQAEAEMDWAGRMNPPSPTARKAVATASGRAVQSTRAACELVKPESTAGLKTLRGGAESRVEEASCCGDSNRATIAVVLESCCTGVEDCNSATAVVSAPSPLPQPQSFAPLVRSRGGTSSTAGDGNGCGLGTWVVDCPLQQLFALEQAKFERMMQETCVEGRAWRGIIRVGISAPSHSTSDAGDDTITTAAAAGMSATPACGSLSMTPTDPRVYSQKSSCAQLLEAMLTQPPQSMTRTLRPPPLSEQVADASSIASGGAAMAYATVAASAAVVSEPALSPWPPVLESAIQLPYRMAMVHDSDLSTAMIPSSGTCNAADRGHFEEHEGSNINNNNNTHTTNNNTYTTINSINTANFTTTGDGTAAFVGSQTGRQDLVSTNGMVAMVVGAASTVAEAVAPPLPCAGEPLGGGGRAIAAAAAVSTTVATTTTPATTSMSIMTAAMASMPSTRTNTISRKSSWVQVDGDPLATSTWGVLGEEAASEHGLLVPGTVGVRGGRGGSGSNILGGNYPMMAMVTATAGLQPAVAFSQMGNILKSAPQLMSVILDIEGDHCGDGGGGLAMSSSGNDNDVGSRGDCACQNAWVDDDDDDDDDDGDDRGDDNRAGEKTSGDVTGRHGCDSGPAASCRVNGGAADEGEIGGRGDSTPRSLTAAAAQQELSCETALLSVEAVQGPPWASPSSIHRSTASLPCLQTTGTTTNSLAMQTLEVKRGILLSPQRHTHTNVTQQQPHHRRYCHDRYCHHRYLSCGSSSSSDQQTRVQPLLGRALAPPPLPLPQQQEPQPQQQHSQQQLRTLQPHLQQQPHPAGMPWGPQPQTPRMGASTASCAYSPSLTGGVAAAAPIPCRPLLRGRSLLRYTSNRHSAYTSSAVVVRDASRPSDLFRMLAESRSSEAAVISSMVPFAADGSTATTTAPQAPLSPSALNISLNPGLVGQSGSESTSGRRGGGNDGVQRHPAVPVCKVQDAFNVHSGVAATAADVATDITKSRSPSRVTSASKNFIVSPRAPSSPLLPRVVAFASSLKKAPAQVQQAAQLARFASRGGQELSASAPSGGGCGSFIHTVSSTNIPSAASILLPNATSSTLPPAPSVHQPKPDLCSTVLGSDTGGQPSVPVDDFLPRNTCTTVATTATAAAMAAAALLPSESSRGGMSMPRLPPGVMDTCNGVRSCTGTLSLSFSRRQLRPSMHSATSGQTCTQAHVFVENAAAVSAADGTVALAAAEVEKEEIVVALEEPPPMSELPSAGGLVTEANDDYWHEVVTTRYFDPTTGNVMLLLVQTDVTAKVRAERHIALVSETEHRLLEQIFPRHVLAYMTEEGGPWGAQPNITRWRPVVRDINKLATAHDEVTLLFADIQGFTPMCKVLEPHVVMTFLNDLFTRFDRRLDEFGVYKVETIGDCYMVAGGLVHEDEDGMMAVRDGMRHRDRLHAERVFMFAKAMLSAASGVSLPTTGGPVQMRIGIHTGPVVSGVVGQRMPRFCLFGDTVNTASRMESTGVPGCIHASEAAWRLLRREAWVPTGGIEVKGRGQMQTYLWSAPDAGLSTAEVQGMFSHDWEAMDGCCGKCPGWRQRWSHRPSQRRSHRLRRELAEGREQAHAQALGGVGDQLSCPCSNSPSHSSPAVQSASQIQSPLEPGRFTRPVVGCQKGGAAAAAAVAVAVVTEPQGVKPQLPHRPTPSESSPLSPSARAVLKFQQHLPTAAAAAGSLDSISSVSNSVCGNGNGRDDDISGDVSRDSCQALASLLLDRNAGAYQLPPRAPAVPSEWTDEFAVAL